MKNTIVRAFVLTLVSSGLAASASTAHQLSKTASFGTGTPVPMCGPTNPGPCGMD